MQPLCPGLTPLSRSQPAGWLSSKHAGLARPSHSPPACLNKAAACGDAGCGTRPAGGRWRGRTRLPRTRTEPTPPVWPEQGWRFVGMLDVDPGLQGAAVRSAVGALHPSAGPMAWPGGGQSAGSRCRGASECRTARRIQGHRKEPRWGENPRLGRTCPAPVHWLGPWAGSQRAAVARRGVSRAAHVSTPCAGPLPRPVGGQAADSRRGEE